MGLLAAALLLLGAWGGAAGWGKWERKKESRRQAVRERQSKRMGSAAAPQRPENGDAAVEAPIELGPMDGSQNAWRKNGEAQLGTIAEERWFGGHV